MRGSLINSSSKSLWIAFKYEILPIFCFNCGTIKHHNLGCSQCSLNPKIHNKGQLQYGIWLRVTASKGNKLGSSPPSNKKIFTGLSSFGTPSNQAVIVNQMNYGDYQAKPLDPNNPITTTSHEDNPSSNPILPNAT